MTMNGIFLFEQLSLKGLPCNYFKELKIHVIGLSDADISKQLFPSEGTVRYHNGSIMANFKRLTFEKTGEPCMIEGRTFSRTFRFS